MECDGAGRRDRRTRFDGVYRCNRFARRDGCIRGPRSYRRYGCNWRTRFGGSYGDNWATRSRRCHRRNRSEWLPWLARSRWTNWPGGACRSSGNKWEWLRLPQRV